MATAPALRKQPTPAQVAASLQHHGIDTNATAQHISVEKLKEIWLDAFRIGRGFDCMAVKYREDK